ncbi:MAG: type II secretion system protein [Mariprofundaceae bacterium]|nr:type II secretion system protein [Mariprofundaceae bacterium]
MHRRFNSSEKGFTLIEAIMAMAIISIAMLGLGSFTISIMEKDKLAHDRNQAVQIASQVLEEWSGGTQLPTSVAIFAQGVTQQLNTYSTLPAQGVLIPSPPQFYVVGQQVVAQALFAGGVVKDLGYATYFNSATATVSQVDPNLRVVTVLWSDKKQRDIYSAYRVVLSNMSEVPPGL